MALQLTDAFITPLLQVPSTSPATDAGLDRVAESGLDDWVKALIVFGVALLVATAARMLVGLLDRRGDTQSATVTTLGRIVVSIIVFVGVYIALRTIGLDLGPLVAGAGIVGIAVAFAVKDIGENYIAGVILGLRNPFQIGDQVVSGDHEGTVESLELRHTRLRGYDGTALLLPNSGVLTSPLRNLTVNGRRRTSFTLGVEYDADPEEAMRLAREAVRSCDGVVAEPAPEAYVYELAASSVNICVRYWHEPAVAEMWRVRSAAITAVKRAMDDAGIDMPFDTLVVQPPAAGDDPAPSASSAGR